MRRRTVPVILAALVALPLLAACGETSRDQANRDTAKPLPLASLNPTVYPAPSEQPSGPTAAPATSAPAPGGTSAPPAGKPDEVRALLSNEFQPVELKVKVGTTVTWTSEGGFHTVTGGDGAVDPASPIGDQPMADASATHRVTFDRAGTYPYFCQPHLSLGMKGTIVVG